MDAAPPVRPRLVWVRLNEQVQDAAFVGRLVGISRPTLRKEWRRPLTAGEAGHASDSRRPRYAILALRAQRRLGPKALSDQV